MKNTFSTSFFTIAVVAILTTFISCDKDDAPQKVVVLETKTVSNLPAPQTGGQGQPEGGPFTKFSFSQNAVVTNDVWDIAFRGTKIIVNGGSLIGLNEEPSRKGVAAVSIVTGSLSSITAIPAANTFVQDGDKTYSFPTSGINSWYDYNATSHIISAKAGKVYVVKTHDGKYAKFEILSYYKDAPSSPDATSIPRFYTFKFVYQNNSSTSF
jgi:hypothetical protein